MTSFLYLFFALLSIGSCKKDRYLTYTVNVGEGFNLRRDVHMRAAILVHNLRKSTEYNWILVLPPWPRLYHWKSPSQESWLPWRNFFDIDSLNEFVPSIEFDQYILKKGGSIDSVLGLQKLQDSFTDGGTWIETVREEQCREKFQYTKGSNGQWTGDFFGQRNFHAKKFKCLSVQGRTSVLVPELSRRSASTRSFMLLRFEQLLHDEFGGIDYWNARRSMVYAEALRIAGNEFMKNTLNYDPGRGIGRSQPNNKGGNFLSVHLRRQDYAKSKPRLVPSLAGAANQIKALKKENELKVVFISTDASQSDKVKLSKLIGGKVTWLDPDSYIGRFGDGGVAIIDQWIASHSKFFAGTIESTFSYRIREDRQFMKFPIESTFNQLCGPENDEFDPHSCSPPTKWLLVEEEGQGKSVRDDL